MGNSRRAKPVMALVQIPEFLEWAKHQSGYALFTGYMEIKLTAR